jgi:hypothetical protein
VYDVTTAFRYEDNIETLRIWNSTLGRNVARPFQAASSRRDGLDVQNLLILGSRPAEADRSSNLNVGAEAFVDVSVDDYTPASRSIAVDAGVTIPDVTTDRVGVVRPRGSAYDVGAYEAGQ